jgi:hypothetical protein
MMTTFWN